MRANTRRFGQHEVKEGPFRGNLHYAGDKYLRFIGELSYINSYLERRLVPTEPEEAHMRSIILNLQNTIEYESEELIRDYVKKEATERNLKFLKRIDEDFVCARSKNDWLKSKGLIDEDAYSVMEEIRELRNALVHSRPRQHRIRLKYNGKSLITKLSLRKVLTDVEKTLRILRKHLGEKSAWGTIPPRFATEMGWPKDAVELFDGRTGG